MKGEVQSKKVLVRGKEVFIGVDVHKESWHVTARTEGEEVFHGGIPSQYHALRKLLDHFRDCPIKVAYEAGPFGFWLYDRLTEDGIETINSEDSGSSEIQSLLEGMNWSFTFDFYFPRRRQEKDIDSYESRERIRTIPKFARHGARLIPICKRETIKQLINSTSTRPYSPNIFAALTI